MAESEFQRQMDRSESAMKHLFLFFVVYIAIIASGCGITQPVRPIEEGKTELIASLGGPVIPVGETAFPLPYLNVGLLHGIKQNLTLYGNVHVTALLFKDVGLDAGFSSRLLPEKGVRPEIAFNGKVYFFWDAFRGSTTRLYPSGTVTASLRIGEQSLLYGGADNLYQFTNSTLYVSPFIGYQFAISDGMQMQLESKWLAMNHDTRHGIFEGLGSIGGKGNIGFYIGLQYGLE